MIDTILDAIIKDHSLSPVSDPATGEIVKTFCNVAVSRYLRQKHEYHVFNDKMANQIVAMLPQQSKWKKIDDPRWVQDAANEGKTGLAVHSYAGHGHVAIIAPEDRGLDRLALVSGKWGILCPILGNIGHKNGYMTTNFAFPVADTPPELWLLEA